MNKTWIEPLAARLSATLCLSCYQTLRPFLVADGDVDLFRKSVLEGRHAR